MSEMGRVGYCKFLYPPTLIFTAMDMPETVNTEIPIHVHMKSPSAGMTGLSYVIKFHMWIIIRSPKILYTHKHDTMSLAWGHGADGHGYNFCSITCICARMCKTTTCIFHSSFPPQEAPSLSFSSRSEANPHLCVTVQTLQRLLFF